jgi:hypothetical protein
VPAPAEPRDIRRRHRGATRLAVAAAVAALTLAACVGADPGGPATSPAPAATGAAADGCDTTNLPGWPRPGQVTTSGIIPVLASSERLVGESRLLFALVDDENRPIANEDLQVEIGFFDLCADPATPTEVLAPTFAWGITGLTGFYAVTPTFDRPGTWGAAVAVVDPATGEATGAKLQFTVAEDGTTPRVGEPAPAVRTPTLADVGGDVRRISTDPQPEPAFYETSLEEALAAGEPFLLGFVTPAFCTSAQCGPTIDVIKDAVAEAPIRVVIVEPYELAWDGVRLEPVLENEAFVPVEAADAYGIPTEPWLFLVDRDGNVAGSYEAVVGEQELVDAIRSVTASAGG